jgi:hypothetical protein
LTLIAERPKLRRATFAPFLMSEFPFREWTTEEKEAAKNVTLRHQLVLPIGCRIGQLALAARKMAGGLFPREAVTAMGEREVRAKYAVHLARRSTGPSRCRLPGRHWLAQPDSFLASPRPFFA